MQLPLGLFGLVGAAIVALWWWLGAAVPMPPSPLGVGAKLYCLSYAPFRGSEAPFDLTFKVDPAQIDRDLARLAAVTDCVRTYSTHNGLDRVPEIAARHGLKVIQGIWLGPFPEFNRKDVAVATDLAKRYASVIRAVVVGNEVLLRGDMAPSDLIATIQQVKSQIPEPVTYADVWEFWLRYPDVAKAVDFVTIHILPYWEDFPVSAAGAAAHVDAIRRRVADTFKGKELLIGETGWPSAGRMRAGALPSPANQAKVLHDILAHAERGNYHVNLIEAFDQPWKRLLEGTVGGHWGLFDGNTRKPKFAWGQPVSNHPAWALQAAGGVAFAAALFAIAVAACRRKTRPTPPIWCGVAVMALAGGALAGWVVENVPLEGLGVGGWMRVLSWAGLCFAAPAAGVAALVTGTAIPPFAEILGPAARRPFGLPFWLGLVLIALAVLAANDALGLVFDPRYRDFPFAALTAAGMPFLVLRLAGRRRLDSSGRAERMFAALFALSAIYVAFNESFANWQSVWFCAGLLALAVTIWRGRGARSSG